MHVNWMAQEIGNLLQSLSHLGLQLKQFVGNSQKKITISFSDLCEMSWWSQSSKQLFFYQQKTTITIGYLLIIRGGSKNLRQRLRGHPAGSLSSHVGEKAYQSCAGAACAALLKETVGVVSSKMFSLSSLISGKFAEFRRHIFSAAEETELYVRCFLHFFSGFLGIA